MPYMAVVLSEAGTAYHFRAHWFTLGFSWGPLCVAHLFSFLYCFVFFCFVCRLRYVFYVCNVASVSGLSILDCPFGCL